MKPIVLTAEQRKEVEPRRKKTLDRRIYQRLTAVLAVAAGHTPEDVAQLLGVDLTQLSQWLRVFLNDGLEALCTLADGEPSPSND
jgi:transcriptional regulator with XRE-family HTH domain